MQMLDAVINLKDNFSDTLKNVEKNVGEFQRTYKRTGRDIQRTGRSISGAGSALTKGLTVPLIGMGAGAIKVGMQFESSMSEVAATMGITVDEIQNGSEEFKILEDSAKEMGRTTQYSASESAEALNYLALAGYDAQESTEMLPKVLNLAAAGGLELGQASDMVTDSMDALGLSIGQADTFIDEMAKTAQSSNTDVAQLGEAILVVGANGRDLAGGTAELNTAIGLLGNAGIKGAEAGTKLRNIIMAMTPTTKKAKTAFKQLGVESYDVNGNLRPLNETMIDISKSMEGMTSKEKSQIMSQIFNKQDLAAASTLLASVTQSTEDLDYALGEMGISTKGLGINLDDLVPMMKNFSNEQEFVKYAMDEFGTSTEEASAIYSGLMGVIGDESAWDDLASKIDSAEGTAKEMADTLMHNLKGAFIRIKSAMEGVGIQIYEILKPALNDAADFIQKVVDAVNNLTPEQVEMIGRFVKLAVVIGPVLLVIGKMTEKVGGLVTEFGFLAQRIGNVGFFKAFMTPGVKVALVLAAIAGVAYIVYKNWDKIKPVVDKVTQAFKDFWEKSQPVVEWLKETAVKAFELLKESVVKLGEGFKNLWDKLKPLATWVKEELIEAFETFKERLNSLKEYIEPLKEKFDEFKEALIPLKEEFNKLKEEFETLQPVLEVLLGFVAGVFAVGFVGTFYTLIELVSGAIESMIIIFGGLLEYLSGIITFLTGVFTGDWEMAWEGLQSIISGFVEIVSGLWNGLITLLTAPIDAVVNLIDNNFGDKAQNIIDWWSKVKEFLKNPIKGVVNLFQNNNNSGKQRGGSSGRQRGGNVGSNYKGTNFWRGGLTEIHERGAEIIDLPRGTRIYPHDKSLQMAIEQGRAEAQNRNDLDKVIPFGVPKVTDDVRNVKQNVIPITSIERPDQTGFDLGRLETQNQSIVQTVIPLNIPDVPDKIQNIKQQLIPADVPNVIDTTGNNQTIIPINDVPEENKKGTKGKKRTIYIEKLAETVVVREDADVDRIVDKLVSKLEEAAFNTA